MQRDFGRLPDGDDIHAITLTGDAGLHAEVLTYGGILRRLSLETGTGRVDLVLGLPDLASYLADRDSVGILVGRFGNRIAGARFRLDGCEHVLSGNEGRNHLHGGYRGFGRMAWTVREYGSGRLVLGCRSPAGDEGYPGTLEVTATFRVQGSSLELEYAALSDAPTPVNLTHHPYFNLAGDPVIPAARQWLRIPADRYLPVDGELIPTGDIASVAGTPFDFRRPTTPAQHTDPAHAQIVVGHGYDHCLVLADGADCVAELYSSHSGVAMRITSDAPAVQFYEGQGLDARHPELGRGLCLEPQGFPDAPNQPRFPDAILRPGQLYRRYIRYQFARVAPGSDWDTVAAALDRCVRSSEDVCRNGSRRAQGRQDTAQLAAGARLPHDEFRTSLDRPSTSGNGHGRCHCSNSRGCLAASRRGSGASPKSVAAPAGVSYRDAPASLAHAACFPVFAY